MNKTISISRLPMIGISILSSLFLFSCKKNLDIITLPEMLSFQGDSSGLQHTEIVPTMDTPASGMKNIIWCGSFPLAWKKLSTDVTQQPIQLAIGNEIAERLNQDPFTESDLLADSFYAAAGWANKGIKDKIIHEMAKRFPDVKPSVSADPSDEIISYSYLQASVEFKVPFLPYERQFLFTNSDGSSSAVQAFGVFSYDPAIEPFQKQIEILYQSGFDPRKPEENKEYVIDLSRKTKPYQILLASVPFRESLRETVHYVETKMKEPSLKDYEKNFQPNDTLLVPDMAWKISHQFKEITGPDKTLLNPGFEGKYISNAIQDIEFTLNHKGARLRSESGLGVACLPRDFIFDHPFLLLIRLRGNSQPIFVLWMSHTELAKPAL